jgi:threonine/homoserine/homoserine lactone efflux protein
VTQGTAFRQGVLNNLANPKMVLLFLTLLPQFVSTNEPRLATTGALVVVFLILSIVWWRTVSLLVAALSRVLSSPTVRVRIDRVTGIVLIALGLNMALDNP